MNLSRFAHFLRSPLHQKRNALAFFASRLRTETYYRFVCGSLGRNSRIDPPLLLTNPQFLHIGNRTMIRRGARIEAIVLDQRNPPSIRIGNNVNIEQNVHIVCSSSITIEDNVSITGNCSIVDTKHPYEDSDGDRKIGDCIDPNPTPVRIGKGSFLGFGAIILPGVSIGTRCVIGANCIVVRDVPDYSVVSGSPAVVLRNYRTPPVSS